MEKLKLNRRKFLGALSLGTAHLMFANKLEASPGGKIATHPLQRVKLGKSGIETTLLGFGTGVHAGNRVSALTRQGRQSSVALLRHAYDKGIRLFDCADSYGTHGFVAEAFKDIERRNITLTSKIWVRSGGIPEPERPNADIVVDRFRKELNTDYIDLVQIHCMEDDNWTETLEPQMEILETLKAKGIIRAHGVSVHSLPAMKAALASPWVDVIHVRINPYGIAMDRPEPEEVVEVIHQLHAAGKGVIGMKLIGNGTLRNDSKKINNALRFVLGLKSVDTMIVGFEETEQVDNYIARMEAALKDINFS